MAVTQLQDGRWVCYYRVSGLDRRRRIKKEYLRKSNTLGGIIDRLEFYEAELNIEIDRLKDPY